MILRYYHPQSVAFALRSLVCIWVLHGCGYADTISFNSVSAYYIASDAEGLGPKISREVNSVQFLKTIFDDFSTPPILKPASLVAHVKLSIKETAEHGSLSLTLETNDLQKEARDYAFEQIKKYVVLRARGYTADYAKCLLFNEDKAQTKKALDPIGQAIVNEFQNVLPSKLKRIAVVDQGTWTRVLFEIQDGGYRWIYDAAVTKDGKVEEIREGFPIAVASESKS